RGLRDSLARRDPGFKAPARRLHGLLLGPVERALSGQGALAIVPDRPLWEVPIQALGSEGGRYAIEDRAVFYAPSLAVLRQMAPCRAAPSAPAPRLLAVGLSALPQAEAEVRELAKLYGSARSAVYTGPAAQEETVKAEMARYDVVHLATHGVLEDASPMSS